VPADPTPADRHRAMQLLVAIPDATDRAALVARALADERERARAPFLALADGYELGDWIPAYRIHRALEEPTP
jgi:hypothetical protein